MWNDIGSFLSEQCQRRNLSWNEASLAAGLDHGAISRFVGGTVPSAASCTKLARFFGVPDPIVLRLAGHLNTAHDNETIDPEVEAIARRIGAAKPEQRDKVMRIVLTALENEDL